MTHSDVGDFAQTFDQGITLFNTGNFWDAHEVIEVLWKQSAIGSVQRHLLQGIIQLAAGCLKRAQGNRTAALSLCSKALGHLEHVPDVCMTVCVRQLANDARSYLQWHTDAVPLVMRDRETCTQNA